MNTTVSFDYFMEKAKEHVTNVPDYSSLCLDALALKSKNLKSLEAVHEEMQKIRLQYWAYRLAYEATTPAVLDVSLPPIVAPMIKSDKGWRFKGNKAIEQALAAAAIDLSDISNRFSFHDREQIAQYLPISYYEYCALPFVRQSTKKQIFKMLAAAENDNLKEISPKSFQQTECIDEVFRFKTNPILSILTPIYGQTAEEKEQIRQLSGDLVVPN